MKHPLIFYSHVLSPDEFNTDILEGRGAVGEFSSNFHVYLGTRPGDSCPVARPPSQSEMSDINRTPLNINLPPRSVRVGKLGCTPQCQSARAGGMSSPLNGRYLGETDTDFTFEESGP